MRQYCQCCAKFYPAINFTSDHNTCNECLSHLSDDGSLLRQCLRCYKFLADDRYYPNPSNDMEMNNCISCIRSWRDKRKFAEDTEKLKLAQDKAKIAYAKQLEYNRKWREANPDKYRESVRNATKRWRASNKTLRDDK